MFDLVDDESVLFVHLQVVEVSDAVLADVGVHDQINIKQLESQLITTQSNHFISY